MVLVGVGGFLTLTWVKIISNPKNAMKVGRGGHFWLGVGVEIRIFKDIKYWLGIRMRIYHVLGPYVI
jgi:hypothetical protein